MDKKTDSGGEEKKEGIKRFTIKNATDLQRIRLEKLMKNPVSAEICEKLGDKINRLLSFQTKEVIIPNRPQPKDATDTAPSFVRNVMGSSAGAGSGEFHVYRHLRRKEYARLKQIEEKGLTEKLNDNFQQKLDNNKRLAEEKTAKKRAKRLKKKKQSQKKAKKIDPEAETLPSSEESNESDEDTPVPDKSEETIPDQPKEEGIIVSSGKE